MPGHGAAKGKGVAKAVGGIRGKAPVPELVDLAPRPLNSMRMEKLLPREKQ